MRSHIRAINIIYITLKNKSSQRKLINLKGNRIVGGFYS